jgi:nitroreductase
MTIPVTYNHSPLDLIRSRTSVRRYNGEILAGEVRQELERCCRIARRGPFGGACRFQLVDNHSSTGTRGERVGAYGIIGGARTYLAGAAEPSRYCLEDFGYLFELLVLKATDLELGSCWIGAGITRSRFARAIGLREEEILPTVSPVGVPTAQRSLVDRVIRWGAGSKHRKPWEELFGDAGTAEPLSRDGAGRFATALEMVRLAPSASNRQPWRCLRAGDTIHFFLQRFPGYQAVSPTDLQRVDMGIAMAHFELAMEAEENEGTWQVLDPAHGTASALEPPESWQKAEYLVSWVERRPRDAAAGTLDQ